MPRTPIADAAAPIALLYLAAWVALFSELWALSVFAYGASVGLLALDCIARQRGRRRTLTWVVAAALLWPVSIPVYLLARRGAHTVWVAGMVAVAVLLLAADSVTEGPSPEGIVQQTERQMSMLSAQSQEERKSWVMSELERHPYAPPWWMRNPHVQTFWGPMVRKGVEVDYRNERWETPDDDFFEVKFTDGDADKPVLLMLHGLEGSADSFYIKGSHQFFGEVGWTVATMEFRFCSGEINRQQQIYHMGATWDCDLFVRKMAERYPDRSLYLCGFSLGGNVLAKWLGEAGDTVPKNVRAAVVISPPFNPAESAPEFHEILGGFYAWNFLRTLKPKALAKAEQFPGIIDVEAVKACKDFYTYDTVVTAALHGFGDAEDYWRKVGCHQFLEHIRVPTMLLTSADDPFNPADTIPHEIAEASPWLHPQWTERGGHVAFVMGRAPFRPRYWSEEQTLRFFQAYETLAESAG